MMSTLVRAAALLFPLFASMAIGQPSREFIFPVGSAPFAASHASTIVQLKNGDLLAAWFGGTDEGYPDVAIWAARRSTSGWSAPIELAREPHIACWNPVLFHSANGLLWLYYKYGPAPFNWVAARRFSLDEGRTWSPVQHLPAGLLGPIRAKPLLLDNGVIVSGTSIEAYHAWSIWIERSTDNGAIWSTIGPIPLAAGDAANPPALDRTHGLIQPSIVRLEKHHLRLFARSTEDIARICVSDSFNDGLTWSAARPLDLPNPNSGIDAVSLRDGRVVLVYNDSTIARSPLNIAVSHDGEHFQNFRTLESQPGEFSYPAIIQETGGDLDITYTWNRKSIAFVHIPLKDIPN
ncbi:MAG: sialidase family protein [Terracidiphilus sp.]